MFFGRWLHFLSRILFLKNEWAEKFKFLQLPPGTFLNLRHLYFVHIGEINHVSINVKFCNLYFRLIKTIATATLVYVFIRENSIHSVANVYVVLPFCLKFFLYGIASKKSTYMSKTLLPRIVFLHSLLICDTQYDF